MPVAVLIVRRTRKPLINNKKQMEVHNHGIFSDLKEDLSQAVNELMPEEELDQAAVEETKEQPVENTQETTEETPMEPQTEETPNDNAALEEMLKNLDSIEIPQEKEEQPEEETTAEESRIEEAPIGEAVPELDLDSILQNDMTVDSVLKQENTENSKGAEKRMDAKSHQMKQQLSPQVWLSPEM